MKILLNRRCSGTVLVWFLVASVVIVVGGCTVVQMRKWMRRVDGMQDRRLQMTNEMEVSWPYGQPSRPAIVPIELSVTELEIDYWPSLALKSGRSAKPKLFISVNLDGNLNIKLGVHRIQDGQWQRADLSQWYQLDGSGFPYGPYAQFIAEADAVPVTLYSSEDGVEWRQSQVFYLRPNHMAYFEDFARDKAFYRAER